MTLLSYRKLSDDILALHAHSLKKVLSCDFSKSKVCGAAVAYANHVINRSAGAVLNYMFAVNPSKNFAKGELPVCFASNAAIAAAVNLSESSVSRYLRLLAEKGLIMFYDHPTGKRFYNKHTGEKYGIYLVPSCELSPLIEEENLKLLSAASTKNTQKAVIKTRKQSLRRGFERVLPAARAYEDQSFARKFEDLQSDFEKIANSAMQIDDKAQALSMLYQLFVETNRAFERDQLVQTDQQICAISCAKSRQREEAEKAYRKLQREFDFHEPEDEPEFDGSEIIRVVKSPELRRAEELLRRILRDDAEATDHKTEALTCNINVTTKYTAAWQYSSFLMPNYSVHFSSLTENPDAAVPADLHRCACNSAEACLQICRGDQEFEQSLKLSLKKSMNWSETQFCEKNSKMSERVSELDLSVKHTTAKRLLKRQNSTMQDEFDMGSISLELVRSALRCVSDALQTEFFSWRDFVDQIGRMKTCVLFSDDGVQEALQDHSARFLALCLGITMEKSLRDPDSIRDSGAYCRWLTRLPSEARLETELFNLAQSDL